MAILDLSHVYILHHLYQATQIVEIFHILQFF